MAIGVGLIGTGFMGKCHALAWNAVAPVFGDIEPPVLTMLAETGERLAQERARQLGFRRSTGDWRALVTDPAVDVVSITAPNEFHAEMAIAALKAGKHVWCEKPMAASLAEAVEMHRAWKGSRRVGVLGYNYIQNPALRLMRKLVRDGAIGRLNHVRVEMDEDFMADPEGPFGGKSAASSGYGALDDFAVHPLSLLSGFVGEIESVFCDMAKPYATRQVEGGGRRAVETYDIATALLRCAGGVSGLVCANRCAWGRKGRIKIQLFGDRGTIAFDQERLNEVEVFTRDGPLETQGFRTILMGPAHPPYDRFIPAPGHELGFNDLKVIECRELIAAIAGEPAAVLDFDAGLAIERTVHGLAESFRSGAWVKPAQG